MPDQLADALWFAATGASPPAPVLVDLTEPLPSHDQLVSRTLRAARCCARVVLGVARSPVPAVNIPLAQALTLSFAAGGDGPEGSAAFVTADDPMEAAHVLAELVATRPLASAALAMLLQQTALLPVWEGLGAESATYSTLLAGPEFAAWLAAAPPRAAPPDDDEPVLVSRTGDVLTLTLNRPERRNAYGRGVRDALVSALEVARIDEAVTIELEGRGPAFCSGGDLAEFGTTPDPASAHLIRLRHSAGQLLHDLASRTTARLHGACVGAGIELPAFAGRVVAAANTQIALPEVHMGLVPGAGGTVSIAGRIGRWRTAWLALTGQRLSASQALAWGLVDELVP
jgi:hypothetical protein